jgi:hypothetical protein
MNILQLRKEHHKTSTVKMPNNLDAMIRRSGLLNKEVAERKGCRPETVSRQISGALGLSVKDAQEYAVILDCNPQEILFPQKANMVFGTLDNCVVKVASNADKREAYFMPYLAEDRMIVIANHSQPEKKWANGRMYLFNPSCLDSKSVDENSFMKLSIMKMKDYNDVRFGVPYPEPGGLFTVNFNADSHVDTAQRQLPIDVDNSMIRGVELVWATPILGCIFQPDLVGVVKKD